MLHLPLDGNDWEQTPRRAFWCFGLQWCLSWKQLDKIERNDILLDICRAIPLRYKPTKKCFVKKCDTYTNLEHQEKLNLIRFPLPYPLTTLIFCQSNIFLVNLCHSYRRIFFQTNCSSHSNGWIFFWTSDLSHLNCILSMLRMFTPKSSHA